MKPVIYWTLLRNWGKFKALGVTSEGPRGRVNGRFTDEHPTHTNKRDCVGRFDKLSSALDKIVEIEAVAAKYAALRKPHDIEINRFYDEENRLINDICKGLPVE